MIDTMTTVGQRVFLSTTEYEVLWSRLRLGRMPYPLNVPSTGILAEDRARVVRDAWASLAGRHLVDGDDVHDGLLDMLRLLARFALSIDVVGHAGGLIRGLVVTGPQDDGTDAALRAELTGSGLTLTSIRPTALAHEAAGLLPAVEPGPGQAFTFPRHVLQTALDDSDDVFFDGDEADALVRAGLPEWDARLLVKLADRVVNRGQIGINTRNWLRGTVLRDPTLITWLDTDEGRYLVIRENDWISVAPAGHDRIVARVNRALESR